MMRFLTFLFFKVYRIHIKDSLLLLIPLWLCVTYFIYYSFYKPFKRTDLGILGKYDQVLTSEIVHLYLHSEYVRLKNFLNSKTVHDDPMLPVYDLYFNDSDLAKLFRNLPDSGKDNFIPGKLVYEAKTYGIKAKLRGGSYWHFQNDHKSWRIKLENKMKINGLSEFDLVNPKFVFSQSDSIVFDLVRNLKLWDIENRMVRVNLNNKYTGHSFTLDRLDQNFLLRNKKVSGSIYGIDIGSQIGPDSMFYFSPLAWKNGRDWTVYTSLNHEINRGLELYELAKVLRSDLPESFNLFFMKYFDLNVMFSTMSLDSLLGVFHHSNITSIRYYFNNKEGIFLPITWDSMVWMYEDMVMLSRNIVYDKIRMDPRLNELFLKKLYHVFNIEISEKDLVTKIEDSCHKLNDAVSDDPNKDGFGVHSVLRPRREQVFPYSLKTYKESCTYFKNHIAKRFSFLKSYFKLPNIDGKYRVRKNYTEVLFSHNSGVSPKLRGIYKNGSWVKSVYYDSNNNNIWDAEDKKINFSNENMSDGKMLYAINHLIAHKAKLDITGFEAFVGKFNIHHRRVNYLYFVPEILQGKVEAQFEHPYNNDLYKSEIVEGNFSKIKKDHHFSKPIEHEKSMVNIGPGLIKILKTKVYDQEVIIQPGTEFVLSKNVSMIFKRKVVMKGNANQQISFVSENEVDPFGAIVITGEKASKSEMHYVTIQNGSQGYNGLSEYSGALSLYTTKDILLDHLSISSSCENCLGINFYKVSNFHLEKSHVSGFSSSLVKLELSEGKIADCEFKQTLSNSLYLVFSELKLENTKLSSFFKSGIHSFQSKLVMKDVSVSRGEVGVLSDSKRKARGVSFFAVKTEFKFGIDYD